MWIELIKRLDSQCTFSDPASVDELASAEQRLGIRLPRSLHHLLAETNGVRGKYGLGLVWPIDRIVQDNVAFRANANFKQLYMPFDCLLFIADAGNGDQFGFTILAGQVRRDDIFVWNHENDGRTWAAPSLELYLEWWLSGKLSV